MCSIDSNDCPVLFSNDCTGQADASITITAALSKSMSKKDSS